MSDAPREVSPEEYREMVTAGRVKTTANSITINRSFLTTAAIVVVSLLVGFYIGMDFQKSKSTSSATTTNGNSSQNGFGNVRGGARRGVIGQVTAISSTSVTVQNQRSGSNEIYKITSSTTVSNNGSNASVSDIKAGDTVLIRVSSSDASTAASILINPSFGGAGGFSGQSQSDNPSSSGSSDSMSSTI